MNMLITKIIIRIQTTILFVIMFSIVCFAGNTGKISGKVTDKANGEPLVGANVFIQGLNTGASTDLNGEYFILNIHHLNQLKHRYSILV